MPKKKTDVIFFQKDEFIILHKFTGEILKKNINPRVKILILSNFQDQWNFIQSKESVFF